MHHDSVLILGGPGLVGTQVARALARSDSPPRVIFVAGCRQSRAEEACRQLRQEFAFLPSHTDFIPQWGNIFVPSSLAYIPRSELLASPTHRQALLRALYDNFEEAYQESHLVKIVLTCRPEAIVDCVNTATCISYQDVFEGAARVRESMSTRGVDSQIADLETLLLSQGAPQLIRHVLMLHRAASEAGTRVYMKVGTTGTGGMGVNIPYTHSEEKPSKKLLAKTEAGFGHTGLLFALSRTPGPLIVKELKPAALIAYRRTGMMNNRDKNGNGVAFFPREETLAFRHHGEGREIQQVLELSEDPSTFQSAGPLRFAVVDTGENGVFARGEFAAISAFGQMEFLTPEEIAAVAVRELQGGNTGLDVIAAVNGSVMGPSYKAGLLRQKVMSELREMDREMSSAVPPHAHLQSQTTVPAYPSIALGRLGPPQLSKLLFECALLRQIAKNCARGEELGVLLEFFDGHTDEDIAMEMCKALELSGVRLLAPSVGVPVLLPDGHTLLRGPTVNVPEVSGHRRSAPVDAESVDAWARRGWVDLRVQNVASWRERLMEMVVCHREVEGVEGSAGVCVEAPGGLFVGGRGGEVKGFGGDFEIGDVVGWIFNNEMRGCRETTRSLHQQSGGKGEEGARGGKNPSRVLPSVCGGARKEGRGAG
uniref:Uncharacterized protein n=1 Tax=Chromera velia CCMP2878 TaxID=1169474 RepID=A0A0G4HWW4_9ALVE|eukprot:Cvel_9152.t1-p1 / transcript=Cvel_9152.t1 / gene=Cvel_9152 / organism=Chromera_velia_CCMP2878 / gene_product=hypothetical protein / transcript_product=hypothetical protein / location=Cvel_scaffold521:15059-17635(-) / protein_length=651 / sequence_SO=supercontig / SO=protein_coding / is_pseudo=false